MIKYLVITSHKYRDRQNNISLTWGADADLVFYSDETRDEPKTIKTTDDDTYAGAEHKHVNMVRLLEKEFLDSEWFFFCDDDTFVNTKLLEDFVKGCDPDTIYGNIISCWPNVCDSVVVGYFSQNENPLHYPSGGAGLLMSRKVLNILSTTISHRGSGYGDVALGLAIRDSQIKMQHDDRFHGQPPASCHILDTKQHFTFHYIKDLDMMLKLYNQCQ